MKKSEIAISLGSSETVIYLKGAGIVIRESSIALHQTNGSWIFGNDAKKQVSKTGSMITFINPIVNGYISDEEVCSLMLKSFLSKIISRGIFEPNIKALFCVPCGISLVQKSQIKNMAFAAGITEVIFVPVTVCIKLGYGLPAYKNDTYVVCDIGGGKTDITVVTGTQILSGVTLSLGGRAMDFAIQNYIERSYSLKISNLVAEKFKIDVGSLHEGDKGSLEVTGFDSKQRTPQTEVLYASDVRNSLLDFYVEIINQTENLCKSVGADISADLLNNGILMAGGGSNISGLDKLFKTRLQLPISICEDSENVCMLGAKQILASCELEKKIIEDN